MMQSLEDQRFSDRRDAIRRRWRDPGPLNCDVQGVRFLAADPMRIGSRADLRRFADALCQAGADARERRRQKLRDRASLRILEHRYKLAQLDSVGMRLDLDGFAR